MEKYKALLLIGATGTGKTITALSASVELLQKRKELLTIVSTPYTHLSKQWQKEMENFGYRPLLVAESRKKWLEKTSLLVRDVKAGRVKHASLVTTNASFLKSSLRNILEEYESVSIAAKAINSYVGSIVHAIQGIKVKKHRGFKWRYKQGFN